VSNNQERGMEEKRKMRGGWETSKDGYRKD